MVQGATVTTWRWPPLHEFVCMCYTSQQHLCASCSLLCTHSQQQEPGHVLSPYAQARAGRTDSSSRHLHVLWLHPCRSNENCGTAASQLVQPVPTSALCPALHHPAPFLTIHPAPQSLRHSLSESCTEASIKPCPKPNTPCPNNPPNAQWSKQHITGPWPWPCPRLSRPPCHCHWTPPLQHLPLPPLALPSPLPQSLPLLPPPQS